MIEVQSTLVGVTFRGKGARAIVQDLDIGSELHLEAEPDNAYDPNAVKVIHPQDGMHIGYLSRESNSEVAEHLANDGAYTCRVISFLSDIKPHLSIELYAEDEVED